MTAASPDVHLREVNAEDLEAVAALHEAVGFCPPDAETWRWLWDENPARARLATDWPRGWVLERGGVVGGYLANLPLAAALGERELSVAVPRALMTAPDFASQGLRLVSRYLKQRGPDLCLCTTANAQASPIWEGFRMSRVPQADLDEVLFWPLREGPFIGAFARTRGLPGFAARGLGALTGPALGVSNRLRGCRIPRPKGSHLVTTIDPEAIDGAFDDLWTAKRHESVQLMGSRSSEVLRWHLAERPVSATTSDRQTVVFRLHGRPGLRGYAVSETRAEPRLALTRTRLIDLVVLGDDEELVAHLLWHVQEHAR
ncbi:MAG: hypothetical protein QF464_12535, partial [Myxococcota bacterium]|nr:hypothetical protein [Myxococcota bacterium]